MTLQFQVASVYFTDFCWPLWLIKPYYIKKQSIYRGLLQRHKNMHLIQTILKHHNRICSKCFARVSMWYLAMSSLTLQKHLTLTRILLNRLELATNSTESHRRIDCVNLLKVGHSDTFEGRVDNATTERPCHFHILVILPLSNYSFFIFLSSWHYQMI